jgi:hypothetical protein
MLPQLPKFGPLTVGARLGEHINAIRNRLYAQRLVSSATIKITDTDRGQRIDRVGGGAASTSLPLGFLVTDNGSAYAVGAGKVLTPDWSGATGNDFKPYDWTLESNFVGTTISYGATAIWLQVQFTETDTTSEGWLGTTDIDISGGAGGNGGGGGGGGASNEDTSLHYVTGGATGDGADIGGSGGLGGGVFEIADDDAVASTGGYGEDGGAGGDGGAGSAGTSETFTRARKATLEVRHYELSNISAHSTKGTPSETSAWIKLATISGGVITQHHAGTLNLAPSVLTFLAP